MKTNAKNILNLVGTLFILLGLTIPGAHGQTKNKASRISERKAARQDVLLIAGLQTTLDIPFEPCTVGGNYEECIRIANKGIVQVQFSKDKKQLIFTPLKKGETSINLRDDSGDIKLILRAVVSDNNLTRRLVEMKELLRDIEGIDIRIMAEKIVIDGEVIVLSDLNRLYTILNDPSYKGFVLNLVTLSPVGMQILADRIAAEINNPNIKVRVLNGLFLLEGQVESATQIPVIEQIAKSMVQGFVLPNYNAVDNNPIDVRRAAVKDPIIIRISIAPQKPAPAPKMVRITVDFVELSKDYLRNFGFSFSPSLDTGGTMSFGQSTTGGVTTQGNGSLSGTIGNLFPKLSTAQNAGYARILEESVMIVKTGEEVELKRQLEVPIQTVNDRNQPIFNKVNIGPLIKMTPKIQGQTEDVDLRMDFTYNGFAGKQGSLPIVLTHTYKSDLVVKSGESAAVVNALSNSISTAFNKDPPGGSVPANPLFTLLRSKAFQKNKSQFVVFLTPQILENSVSGTEDIKQRYGIRRKK